MIRVGTDFSGIGSFEQALKNLKIEHTTVFACDSDKYARQTYIANHGHPQNMSIDVATRSVPTCQLDIYMATPPCQPFSLAGEKKGEDDERGVLFYNTHEFIKRNQPRYFILENVKGLIDDDNGRTFKRWLYMLGGKSINGTPVIFPHWESVPYHIYWKVMNPTDFDVPQFRQRVFIIGVKHDEDNTFRFPKIKRKTKKMKDLLDSNVSKSFYLSDVMLEKIERISVEGRVANLNKGGQRGLVYGINSDYITSLTATDYKQPPSIMLTDEWNPCEIRYMTPKECIRFMGFPETFKTPCSNTQTYKQAGNSVVVQVLEEIIKKLKL